MTHPSRLLSEAGLRPRKQLGQNFLADPNVLRKIAQALAATPEDEVLEIGTGTGALTRAVAESGARVTTVEIDFDLFDLAERELADLANVSCILGDALDAKPDRMAERAGRPILVCGNLPYQASSEITFFVCEHHPSIARAVLMYQRELAERIRAEPGGKDYGILSVLVQYRWRVEPVMNVPASCFYPAPQVDSAVLRLVGRERPEPEAADEKLLARLVRTGFGQRRKTLRNSLAGEAASTDDAATRLESAGINPSRRPETLSVAEWVAVANTWEGGAR